MHNLFLLSASFLASAVEMVEALTIVLAAGVTRGWRSSLIGVGVAVLVAVGEGDDKPVKYPPMVRASEVLVITKTDLVPYTDSDPARIKANALKIRPDLEVFQVSVKTPEGLDVWTSWLSSRLKAKKRMAQGK